MASGTRYALVAPTASVLLLAAASKAAAEMEATEPDVTRRPDTSSFHFASTFQGEDALRTGEWVLSKDPKYDGQDSRVRVDRCNLEGGVFHGDFGLLLDESHKHYAVGATLSKPFDNTGKDLVMQYEVQVRGGAKCGGAYVKMLREEVSEDLEALKNDSPYSIMFGPDKCFRDTNKVHFIFQHENPITKEWQEKHFKDAPKIKEDKGFHLYTLHVKADNTFDLYIDAKVAASGNLLKDFEPPVNPPKEIDNPEDEQPDDWVTEAKIHDPSAVKPDDWDEDAPKKIIDESATMPKGWIEDAEEFIQDPAATRPTDWDDEEDGEWEPPVIANPLCETSPGCGKWEQPLKKNPDYKGKWKPPKIDNPDYVGPWSPSRIENPDYFEDSQPSNMAPITGLAIEVWSVDGGVWFDNFIVGDDLGAALKLAEETWRPKVKAYEAVEAAEKKKKDAEKKKKDAEKKKKKRERDAANSTSKLLETSRYLVDKTRPYIPSSFAPALDAAAESPISCLVTLLAGMLAVLVLVVRSGRKPSRAPVSVPAPASAQTSAPPAQNVSAKDDVDDVIENDVADADTESDTADTATVEVRLETKKTAIEKETVIEKEADKEEGGEAKKEDGDADLADDPAGTDEAHRLEGAKDEEAEESVKIPAPVSSAT